VAVKAGAFAWGGGRVAVNFAKDALTREWTTGTLAASNALWGQAGAVAGTTAGTFGAVRGNAVGAKGIMGMPVSGWDFVPGVASARSLSYTRSVCTAQP
jgi:hypothetical protein